MEQHKDIYAQYCDYFQSIFAENDLAITPVNKMTKNQFSAFQKLWRWTWDDMVNCYGEQLLAYSWGPVQMYRCFRRAFNAYVDEILT